jgi:Glycine cleavage H-protein
VPGTAVRVACLGRGASGGVPTRKFATRIQGELGDVVYVELPSVGEALAAKDTFGVVESVKTASDVYMPVSGEVVEANETLASEPGLVRPVLVVPGQPRAPDASLCWTDAV